MTAVQFVKDGEEQEQEQEDEDDEGEEEEGGSSAEARNRCTIRDGDRTRRWLGS